VSRWMSVGVWASLIYCFSSAAFSLDRVTPYAVAVLRVALPAANAEDLFRLSYMLRKSVHPLEYFVLGVLVLRAIRGPRAGWQLRWAVCALLLSALFATSDEFRQMFVPGRTASVKDVFLDVSGAAFSQIVTWVTIVVTDTAAESCGGAGLTQRLL
jgi:VanZ family protein